MEICGSADAWNVLQQLYNLVDTWVVGRYVGIGILFMLYGYYRAVNRPNMSVVLMVISLGTRVLLSYTLSKISWLGVTGIWVSIPIGWFLADAVGILVYLRSRRLDEKG